MEGKELAMQSLSLEKINKKNHACIERLGFKFCGVSIQRRMISWFNFKTYKQDVQTTFYCMQTNLLTVSIRLNNTCVFG